MHQHITELYTKCSVSANNVNYAQYIVHSSHSYVIRYEKEKIDIE